MKTIIFFILTLSLSVNNAAHAGEWLEQANGYARAKDQASAAGKPIFVYFYTDWCPYCRKFEENILARPDVQTALQKFILVRINPENGSRESDLADSFGVGGYPSLYVEKNGRREEQEGISRAPQKFIDRLAGFSNSEVKA